MSRFTSLPLQASPASLPPASAPVLLLPCATVLVRALVRASSARRRDHCPAAAVGRSRACASLSRRAAARARVPAPACCRLAAASGGRRTSPGCRLLPLPTPGAALWLKPPLLCFTRGTRRGPLLCLAAPARGPLLCFARGTRRGPLLCSAFSWSRVAALLCFLLEQRRAPLPKRLGKRLGAPRTEYSRLGARQWVSA